MALCCMMIGRFLLLGQFARDSHEFHFWGDFAWKTWKSVSRLQKAQKWTALSFTFVLAPVFKNILPKIKV